MNNYFKLLGVCIKNQLSKDLYTKQKIKFRKIIGMYVIAKKEQ